MRRKVAGHGSRRVPRSAALLLALAVPSGTPAGDGGDGPELSPPTEMTAPRPVPAPTRAPTPAVLALPGMARPATRTPGVIVSTPGRPAPAPAAAPVASDPLDVPLDGPTGMSPTRPVPGPSRTLEPLPEIRPGTTVRRPSTISEAPPPRAESAPAPRRGRLFGLGAAPVVVRPAPKAETPKRSDDDDPADDPEAEAALKRRVEKQARVAVGDRARQIEVRVVGQSVAIQARGVRIFQKRAVRKSLESIPALSGLRSTVEVGD